MLVFGYALKYNSLKILIYATNVFVVFQPRQTFRNKAIGKMMLTVFLILILKMHNLKWVLMTKKYVYMDIIETNAGVI
jgi:hypothetical protein